MDQSVKPKTRKTQSDAYRGFRVQITTDSDGHEEKRLVLHQEKLLSWLRDHTRMEDIYQDKPLVDMYSLFNQLDTIKSHSRRYGTNTYVDELVSFLEAENSVVLNQIKNLLARGQMSFGLCKTLFSEGTEIEIHGEELQGARVVSSEFRMGWGGPSLQITYEYITTSGNNFVIRRDIVRIGGYSGTKEISRLPIRPISEETKARLAARGERYSKIGIGAHYMNYSGHLQVKRWWSWDSMRADGRMMVDVGTYGQFVDEYERDDDQDSVLSEISTDQYWMTDAYIKGFSFTTKQWGRFSVSRIDDINYRDDAFDHLVLDEDKKDLVRALVTNGVGGFSDIISGKGGGCIFLLHGEPGVGKTLTAEAIAELLHRPLYSVSVGELGTDTATLEKSLRQILDVAQIWNAVVLIDEADIFLEKRGHDVLRNSLTSVFLRLTEYHQGVLFLTTNRVKTFDPAFYSRISIALKYQGLTQESRAQIWTNLLSAAKVEGLDPQELSIANLNGRQIKNTIRLAQGLAAQQGVSVNKAHVMQVVDISQQFLEDLEGTDY
jgi:ATPase family associated with various cellular activities (AAA)